MKLEYLREFIGSSKRLKYTENFKIALRAFHLELFNLKGNIRRKIFSGNQYYFVSKKSAYA